MEDDDAGDMELDIRSTAAGSDTTDFSHEPQEFRY
jgi:hypothetical protein